MLTFGYHPISIDLDVVLSRLTFQRALVIDDEIKELYEAVEEVRHASETEAALPSGLYWFTGIDSPLLMQVSLGPSGPSSEQEARYISELENHPLGQAFGWAEHFWQRAAPVPAPKFQIGDRAMTVPGGADVEVKSRSFLMGSWSYAVRHDGGLRTELENKLSPVIADDNPEDWVLGERATAERLGATLTRTKLDGKFSDTVYSFQATRTLFRPYQFKPVLKLLQTGQARLLIADEVGLGKTIEAGLIWTELEARHEADRVLVVCPSVLVDKWRDEMAERFGFELTQLTREELNRFLEKHLDNRAPKRKAYVVSLETLRTWDGLHQLEDRPPEFDLVIVDEAHSMRNSSTKSHRLGTQLSEWTVSSNMVFLTATPINLRETDLLNLLGLLEPSDYTSIEDLETRLAPNEVLNEVGKMLTRQDATAQAFDDVLGKLDGLVFEKAITSRAEYRELQDILRDAPLGPKDIARARRLISRLNALSTTITRTRRADVDEKKALRSAEPGIEVVWSVEESEFYQEYLKWCAARAKASKTSMYFSMQMPIRLASTSVHLAAESVIQDDPELWEGDTDESRGKNWVDPHPELVAAAKSVVGTPDSKLERLGEVLAELHALERPALLFTWSKKTLRYLQAAYGRKYRIAVLNGDVPRQDRGRIMRDFRAGGYDFLFANRVASEGLDFEFCSAVINYDLPWNPMEVEQRIGRIDRIGQKSEKILIRNFYNDEAIDSRIMFKVLQRIEIFEKSIGELEPIISQHMDVLHSAMDFELSQEQRDEKSRQFLIAIEAQKEQLQEVSESSAGLMISNDVDIAGLEKDLMSTGRYLGQLELAHLLDDWAQTDGGQRVRWLNGGHVIELKGNATMATRLHKLTEAGRRTSTETGNLIAQLQNDSPISLSLDQELARTTGVELLSATHPLVMAAVDVPGHRHARFASIRIDAADGLAPGKYIVVLAHAKNASQGGDEIWGAAVDDTGLSHGEAPADALLAALARGELHEGPDVDTSNLPRLVSRARLELQKKHRLVQEKRDADQSALDETRRAILADQHRRRMTGIEKRMKTMLEKERGESVIRMVEGQRNRAQERYDRLIAEINTKEPDSVSLEYIAVCVVEVTT